MKKREGVKVVSPRKTSNREGKNQIRITYDGKIFFGRQVEEKLEIDRDCVDGFVTSSNPDTNTLYLDFSFDDDGLGVYEDNQIVYIRVDNKDYGGIVSSCKNVLLETGIEPLERLLSQKKGEVVKSSIIVENPVISLEGERVVEVEIPNW